MIYNILNGDSLAYSFPDAKIGGDIIVVREALMDGDLSGDNLNDFGDQEPNTIDRQKLNTIATLQKNLKK